MNPGSLTQNVSITGDFRGRRLEMTAWSVGDDIEISESKVAFKINSPVLHRQGIIDLRRKIAGKLLWGDARFDQFFAVQSRDVEETRALFSDPNLRRTLIDSDAQRIEIWHQEMVLYYRKVEKDPGHAEKMFNAASDLADAVERLQPTEKKEILGSP